MSEATEAPTEAAAPPGKPAGRAPKVVAKIECTHAGETRRSGQHRYVGKDDDGNQVQVYLMTSKPRKGVTVTIS